jgi:hypothetical protein
MLTTTDPLAFTDLRERAARLLMQAAPLAQLQFEDAVLVIDAMEPVFVRTGLIVMEQGEASETDYMALVLEGEVRAESGTGVTGEEVVVSVIGPGSLIGEMGLLDGAPRSATCTALTDLKLAPFHLLATEGHVHIDKDHRWHMETLAEVCRADPELLRAVPLPTGQDDGVPLIQ